MEYTLTEAAHATGLSRPTILRAIKKGSLSARREEDKSYRIDASELARVFPAMSLKQDDPAPRNGVKRPEIAEMPAASEAELALLRLELRLTKDQLKQCVIETHSKAHVLAAYVWSLSNMPAATPH